MKFINFLLVIALVPISFAEEKERPGLALAFRTSVNSYNQH